MGWKHAYLRDPDGHELSLYWGCKTLSEDTVLKNKPAQMATCSCSKRTGRRPASPFRGLRMVGGAVISEPFSS